MYISVTDNDVPFYSEGFAVRFFKSDGTNWIANFKPGWTRLNAVHEFIDQQCILVIAGGACYLMNPDEEKPKSTFGVCFEAVIKTPDGRLILQDLTDLTIIELNGERWHTERISWDGLKELKFEDNYVSGLAFDPMNAKTPWVEFIVDLEKRIVKGGSFKQYEFIPVGQNVERIQRKSKTEKPWWKLW